MVTAENFPQFKGMLHKLLSEMESTIAKANGEDVDALLNKMIETVGD